MAREVLTGARIFDGARFLDGHALVIEAGEIAAILPEPEARAEGRRAVTGILAPAFLDLQVNGGGGLMLDGMTDLDGLRRICAAHRARGTAGVLPTLSTSTPRGTRT